MLAGVALLTWGCQPRAADAPQIVLVQDAESAVIEVRGLSEATTGRRHQRAGRQDWREVFPVYTGATLPEDPVSHPALLGSYQVKADRVVFKPYLPLLAGQAYTAVWRGSDPEVGPVTVALPAPETPPSRVLAIYPSASELPANLLRVYVVFSAPMRPGQAATHVELRAEDGELVSAPFVAPEHELWNPRATRLTLLFDPGRLKRGVGPNLELGPPLREGRRYQLRIRPEWRDAAGRPLEAGFDKAFAVGAPDRSPPQPSRWELSAPASPDGFVELRADAPLDHALLRRMLYVIDARERRVAGEVAVGAQETVWRMRPERRWRRGRYQLVIDPALEDPAGNSVRRPFETPLHAASVGAAPVEPVRLDFEVPAATGQ